jgi:hypothetical protein
MRIANTNAGTRYHFTRTGVHSNEVSTQLLLSLNSLEQRLEVSSTKSIKVVSLDDFNEDSGAIHHVLFHTSIMAQNMFVEPTYLSEQLEKVTTFVKVNQNIQALDGLKVFLQNQARLLQPGLHVDVVCLGDFDELHASSLQVGDVADDIVGLESNVLDTGTIVEINVLLDLRLLLALRGLIDWHLDHLVG